MIINKVSTLCCLQQVFASSQEISAFPKNSQNDSEGVGLAHKLGQIWTRQGRFPLSRPSALSILLINKYTGTEVI